MLRHVKICGDGNRIVRIFILSRDLFLFFQLKKINSSIFIFRSMENQKPEERKVPVGYRYADFEGTENKGGPLEIRKFFVEWVNEWGWRGVRSLLKPPPLF